MNFRDISNRCKITVRAKIHHHHFFSRTGWEAIKGTVQTNAASAVRHLVGSIWATRFQSGSALKCCDLSWPPSVITRWHKPSETAWEAPVSTGAFWRLCGANSKWAEPPEFKLCHFPLASFFSPNELEWPGGALSLEPRWIFHRASLGCEDRFWRREVKCRSCFFFCSCETKFAETWRSVC